MPANRASLPQPVQPTRAKTNQTTNLRSCSEQPPTKTTIITKNKHKKIKKRKALKRLVFFFGFFTLVDV